MHLLSCFWLGSSHVANVHLGALDKDINWTTCHSMNVESMKKIGDTFSGYNIFLFHFNMKHMYIANTHSRFLFFRNDTEKLKKMCPLTNF